MMKFLLSWWAGIDWLSRCLAWRWLGWFALANTGLMVVIATRYIAGGNVQEEAMASAYTVLMYLGYLPFVVYLLFMPLLLLAGLLPRYRLIQGAGVTLAVAMALLLVVDTFVYQQFRFHINGAVLGLAFGGAGGEIFVFSWMMYIAATAIVTILLLAEWWLARRLWRWIVARSPKRLSGPAIAALLVVIFLADKFIYAWADAVSYTPITQQVRYLPGYQPSLAHTYFEEWGLVEPDHEPEGALKVSSGLQYPLRPLQCTAAEKPLNIVFIVIDSWRFDAIGAEVTPHIHRFSALTSRYQQHFSGGNATRAGIFSLFYGIPSTYWTTMLAEKRGAVFVDELQRQQYELGIFASANLISPEFDRTVFVSVKDLRKETPGRSASERDRRITDEFLSFLDEHNEEKPFFGFLFYDSPHNYDFPVSAPQPFQPSLEQVNYMLLNNDFDPLPFLNRYKNSVHYVDSLVGEVLDKLEREARLEDTVVLLTGDHGQEFNDNGKNYWGHNGNYSRYQTQVPFLLYWPGRQVREVSHTTTHLDVAPTLMQNALNCVSPTGDYSTGHSLFDRVEQPLPFVVTSYDSNFGVRYGELVQVNYMWGGSEVYDDGQSYHRMKEKSLPGNVILNIMEKMGRFYAQ